MNTAFVYEANNEQIHRFVKDKQAWENAIGIYQGPDHLDHWYNYICWYENHCHNDPESKFRETLERVLGKYEHNEFYKSDERMVRLWLKYIKMQPNPLHFYEVLYHRNTGRQSASFYIAWASYYENLHKYVHAEKIYNIAFGEKAQPSTQLENAYGKMMFNASVQAAVKSEPIPQPASQQPQMALQNTSDYHPQQNGTSRNYHVAQETSQNYHPSQQMQHNQSNYEPQNQSSTGYNQVNEQYVPPNQLPYTQQAEQYNQSAASNQMQSSASYGQGNYAQPNQSSAARTSNDLPVYIDNTLTGLRLPLCFPKYSRNSDETWMPALTLAEPDDPLRHCHYAKNLVYPAGIENEFSIEEIHARKYLQEIDRKRVESELLAKQLHQQAVQRHHQIAIAPVQRLHFCYPTDNFAEHEQSRQQQQQEQQQQQKLQSTTTANIKLESNNNKQSHFIIDTDQARAGAAIGAMKIVGKAGDNNNVTENANDDDDENNIDESEASNNGEKDEDNDHEEEEDEENDETDDEEKYAYKVIKKPRVVSKFEDDIEGTTIRYRMEKPEQGTENKTLKIKFRKERPLNNESINSSPYSAYSIERIYQSDIEASNGRSRNGHNFHPYMMTSTPKIQNSSSGGNNVPNSVNSNGSYKRSRSKIRRVCSSSNSTSPDALPNDQPATASGLSNNSTIHNAAFNDNANYSFSSAVAFENSNCSISLAVGRLNFRDSNAAYSNNNNNTNNNNNNSSIAKSFANKSINNLTTNAADCSTYQENSFFATQHDDEAKALRLAKALETIDRHMAKEAIDPFSSELCRAFLTKLDFPSSTDEVKHENYKIIQTPLPKIANTRTLSLPDGVQFNIDKEVGRGSYGSVYKATNVRTGNVVALKFQKPPNSWEIYICDQVLQRVNEPSILPGLMDISTAIIAPNASLIATEFSPFGSLLDINNKIRQATTKVMHESLVMHFSTQICNILHHLHMQKIIHADIKPDNFLLMRIPSTDTNVPSLRLIDFGCAIDMKLFPEPDTTKFRKSIQTDGFTCIEMQEGRPWSYETDLFCIAGTIHVMLFGEYMQIQQRSGNWDIRQKLPRYLKKHVWSKFFGDLLNIKDGKLPNLAVMAEIFDEEAYRMDSELQKQMRSLSNILRRR